MDLCWININELTIINLKIRDGNLLRRRIVLPLFHGLFVVLLFCILPFSLRLLPPLLDQLLLRPFLFKFLLNLLLYEFPPQLQLLLLVCIPKPVFSGLDCIFLE